MLAGLTGVQIYKHSDRFQGGIADLHFTMPGGLIGWIEVKYMHKCVRHRKAGVTDLQDAYLREHWQNGIHGFVLVGVGKQSSIQHISQFDGYVYAGELQSDEAAVSYLNKVLRMEVNHEVY